MSLLYDNTINRCMNCGEVIPEGKMFCPQCEIKIEEKHNEGTYTSEPKKKWWQKIWELIRE